MSYAAAFCARVQAAQPPLRAFPTDISVEGTSFAELVAAMGKMEQVVIGNCALKWLGSKLSRADQWRLFDELRGGSFVLVEGAEGRFQRVNSIVTIEVVNPDGLTLVELGEAGPGPMWVTCRLPGVCRQSGEAFDTVAERLLEQLGPMAEVLNVTGCIVNQSRGLHEWHSGGALQGALDGVVPISQVHAAIQAGLPAEAELELRIRGLYFGQLQAASSADEVGFKHCIIEVGGRSRCLAWLTACQRSFWESDTGKAALQDLLPSIFETSTHFSRTMQSSSSHRMSGTFRMPASLEVASVDGWLSTQI
jgi:hypothetical protein